MAGVNKKLGYQEAELEEAGACLFVMKIALAQGFKRIVMEGDCLTLISKRQRKR